MENSKKIAKDMYDYISCMYPLRESLDSYLSQTGRSLDVAHTEKFVSIMADYLDKIK